MATSSTNLGRVSLVPRGEYDPAAQYERLDIVRYDGSGYLVLRPVQGVTPVNGADYMLISEKGGKGDKGDLGSAAGFGVVSATVDGSTGAPSVEVSASGPDTAKEFAFSFHGLKGQQGIQGDKGDPGSSIASIERTAGTGAPGTRDTYTITLTDGTTSTFQVYNGADGVGAGDMTAAVYDPRGMAQDIFQYVDDHTPKDAVTVPGGGAIEMGEGLGEGPYTFEYSEDGEGSAVRAEQVSYDGTGSGLVAETVQGALDALNEQKVTANNGTVTGEAALLDDMTRPGTYTWLDQNGEMGMRGGLWNVVVSRSRFGVEARSITQILMGTYGTRTAGRVLARAFYYANNPKWTPWRELVSLDQIQNPNLLDNAHWDRPEAIINQRKQNAYNITGINQYFIDRWIGTYISAVLEEDGLLITSDRSPTFSMYQRVENPQALAGKTVTFSLLCSEASSVTMAIRGDIGNGSTNVGGKNLAVDTPGLHTITCVLPENLVILAPGFLVRAGGRIKSIAAKLELGSVQTLAHKEGDTWVLNDPPPDPALELAKCQRYYYRCTGWHYLLKNGSANSQTVTIDFPTTMRAVPTVALVRGGNVDQITTSATQNCLLAYKNGDIDTDLGIYEFTADANL